MIDPEKLRKAFEARAQIDAETERLNREVFNTPAMIAKRDKAWQDIMDTWKKAK